MAKSPKLIEFYKLPTVAHRLEVAEELLARDYHRTAAVVGMERETIRFFEVFVEEEVYMALLVVNQPEWRHRAWLQTEVALHTLWRSEAQLTLMQTMLQVVNSHIAVAVEAHQIVAIALVVAEKEVFAVHRPVIVPILLGNLDCRRFGMKIDLVFYLMCIEELKNPLTAQI